MPFLKAKALSAAADVQARAVDGLVLRAGIFAIVGDDIDAVGAQRRHERVEERRVVVPDRVEDVDAFEEALPASRRRAGSTRIRGPSPRRSRARSPAFTSSENTQRGAERCGSPSILVAEADDARRLLQPGDDAEGIRVGEELLVGIVALRVHGARRHHVGRGVEAQDAAVEIQPARSRSPRPCRPARSWSGKSRACRAARSGDIPCRSA